MDLKLFKRYSRYHGSQLSVMSSRGCPFECSFCCNDIMTDTFGLKIRKRSPENVIQEIKENVENTGVYFNYINVIDDCFIAQSRPWLKRFVELYNELGYDIPILFRAIPQFIKEDKLEILSGVPIGFAFVGLQSGSDAILENVYKRKHSKEKFLENSRALHRQGIPAMYDVIVDNPYEAEEDWEHTIDIVGSLPSSTAVFYYSLTFYKNTSLYDMAKEDGYDVRSHLTKSQGNVCFVSREATALKLAQFLGATAGRKFLQIHNSLGIFLGRVLASVLRLTFEPLRSVKLAYLSQRRSKRRFGRLLLTFSGEFISHWLVRKGRGTDKKSSVLEP